MPNSFLDIKKCMRLHVGIPYFAVEERNCAECYTYYNLHYYVLGCKQEIWAQRMSIMKYVN